MVRVFIEKPKMARMAKVPSKTTGTAQNVTYAIGVMVRALIEHAVKPAKEAFVLAMTAFSDRFQHRGAQRRGQD